MISQAPFRGRADRLYSFRRGANMPQISVMYWNIETFGLPLNYRDARYPYCTLISNVVELHGADVLFIQELRLPALFGTYMQQLQFLLNQLPAPRNNWHYDFIKGSV